MTDYSSIPAVAGFVPPPTGAVFTRFDKDGRILGAGGCALSDYRHQLQPGDHGIVPLAADFLLDYVDLSGEEIVVRRRPAIAGLDALPKPCTVTVTSLTLGASDTYEVTDGAFEYDDLPGAYRITVSAWPYLDATFEVTL